MADFTKATLLVSLFAVFPVGQKQRSSFGWMEPNAAIPKKHWRFMMKVGDLVRNYYKEVGVIIEQWEDEEMLCYERQYYVLYTNGNMELTSEYDLEVICK